MPFSPQPPFFFRVCFCSNFSSFIRALSLPCLVSKRQRRTFESLHLTASARARRRAHSTRRCVGVGFNSKKFESFSLECLKDAYIVCESAIERVGRSQRIIIFVLFFSHLLFNLFDFVKFCTFKSFSPLFCQFEQILVIESQLNERYLTLAFMKTLLNQILFNFFGEFSLKNKHFTFIFRKRHLSSLNFGFKV